MQHLTLTWVYSNHIEGIYFISRASRRTFKGCASVGIRIHIAPPRCKNLCNPAIFVVIASLLAFDICYPVYNVTPPYVQSPEPI